MSAPRNPARQQAEEQEAVAYAAAIRDNLDTTDWPTWNAVIIDRWSMSALERVKRRAWQLVEGGATNAD